MMQKKEDSRILSLLSGIAVSSLSTIFVLFGVSLILFLLESLPISRHLMIIYTTMFYGIFFFIARSGAHIKMHWQPDLYEGLSEKDRKSVLSKTRSLISRVLFIAWFLSGIFAIMLLTPALAIYWISPIHPALLIMLSAFILSLATATVYLIKNDEKFQSVTDRFLFYTGVCLGSIIACYLYIIYIHNQ